MSREWFRNYIQSVIQSAISYRGLYQLLTLSELWRCRLRTRLPLIVNESLNGHSLVASTLTFDLCNQALIGSPHVDPPQVGACALDVVPVDTERAQCVHLLHRAGDFRQKTVVQVENTHARQVNKSVARNVDQGVPRHHQFVQPAHAREPVVVQSLEVVEGQVEESEAGNPGEGGVGHEGQRRVAHVEPPQLGQAGEGGELDVGDGVLVQVERLQVAKVDGVVLQVLDAVPGDVELSEGRQVGQRSGHCGQQGLVDVEHLHGGGKEGGGGGWERRNSGDGCKLRYSH